MKTYEQIVAELDEKIPRDVISIRDGGGGRKLSYLEGHYVIDRLNKVLGQGNWAYTSDVALLYSGVVESKAGPTNSVHYSAKVRLVITITDKPTEFTDYGYGDGTDRTNPGKAHELAIKEAVTDGLKRCAKNLGMSMGLALYDKTQENVDDGEEPKSISRSSGTNGIRSSETETPQKNNSTQSPMAREITFGDNTKGPKEEDIKKLIVSTARVVVALKRLSLEAIQQMIVTDYSAPMKDTLTQQVNQLTLEQSKSLLKTLNTHKEGK